MSNSLKPNWDVIVVGGGPAGFFAAIRCAELNPKLGVLIIEKAGQTLGKIIISGGGRCNVTHACFEPAQLITYYPRGGNELRGGVQSLSAEGYSGVVRVTRGEVEDRSRRTHVPHDR